MTTQSQVEPAVQASESLLSDKRYVHVLYILHGLAPFTFWLLAALAIILGMAKRDDMRGTYLETHVSWLSRTFWWGLLWIVGAGLVTFILYLTIIGIVVAWIPFTLLFLWYLYRVIKGWLRLADGRPID